MTVETVELASNLPLVSVVIPTFNRAATLVRAVKSVLDQTVGNIEVIVVDDHSSDNSMELMAALQDDRLRVIQTPERSGAAIARNTGIAVARAPLVAFQDSDDYWFSYKLEKQIMELDAHPESVMCYCRVIQYYREGIRVAPPASATQLSGHMYTALLHTNLISTQTVVARKTALLSIDGFNTDMPSLEDWQLALQLAQSGPFCFVDEPLVIAFDTPGSLTRSIEKSVIAREIIISQHQPAFLQNTAVHAEQRYIIGMDFLKLHNFRKAASQFFRAWKLRPQNLKYVIRLGMTLVRSAF